MSGVSHLKLSERKYVPSEQNVVVDISERREIAEAAVKNVSALLDRTQLPSEHNDDFLDCVLER